MPYSGENDRNLPANVKSMSKKDRRQWVHIFNSVLSSCMEKGKGMEECETLAFTEADGVLKKERNTYFNLPSISKSINEMTTSSKVFLKS